MVDLNTVNEEYQQPPSHSTDSETSVSDPSANSVHIRETHVDMTSGDETTTTQESSVVRNLKSCNYHI